MFYLPQGSSAAQRSVWAARAQLSLARIESCQDRARQDAAPAQPGSSRCAYRALKTLFSYRDAKNTSFLDAQGNARLLFLALLKPLKTCFRSLSVRSLLHGAWLWGVFGGNNSVFLQHFPFEGPEIGSK